MSTSPPELRVIPAQLSFLTIYCPALARSDETFRDQILFYYSRADKEVRAASRAGGATAISEDELREQENERLRQVGLAQGMVDFAGTFSGGRPVDSVETEKSRIVMRELEKGWWILAIDAKERQSIDLTRLPKARLPVTDSSKPSAASDVDTYEYSSREVSPPGLLIQQLLSAHRTFLLHHGRSLADFMERNGRDRLSGLMDRFWSKFCKYWEVLLHGNPAVDVLGGTKLSAGGELGMGVGEEEWGSGEREVLEDLVHRTEGLVDLVVSRFGDGQLDAISSEDPPWIGRGRPCQATDGVIFGGIGAISRASLRDVSSWVQQIHTFGDYAYGVKDNPSRKRRRQRARASGRVEDANGTINNKHADRRVASPARSGNVEPDVADGTEEDTETEPPEAPLKKMPSIPLLPPDPWRAMHERVASHDHAPGSPSLVQPLDDRKPGIPPPIVSAAEQALAKATSQAQKANRASVQRSPAMQPNFGISDKWMKYLTLGLSTLAKQEDPEQAKSSPAGLVRQTDVEPAKLEVPKQAVDGASDDESARLTLTRLEPMPDGFVAESQMAEQKRLEDQGFFLIGYREALQDGGSNGTGVNLLDQQGQEEDVGSRLLVRTIHVERVKSATFNYYKDGRSDGSSVSTFRNSGGICELERMRVLIYVRRPFIYAFLFEQRETSLQMSAFYKTLHNHLTPLQKPMNRNTAPAHVARMIAESDESVVAMDSPQTGKMTAGKTNGRPRPIYDLLFDPMRLTVHSSIPNIPLPGTHAAEGLTLIASDKHHAWTRIEGLNVHSQILNTLESTKGSIHEAERSAKTSRGWWVVWMRLPPSRQVSPGFDPGDDASQRFRTAILVRKASDWTAPKTSTTGGSSSTTASRMASGMLGLGFGKTTGDDETGGTNTSWGPAGLAGGMGFDARRYVEGLLSLNR
ncbi:hypothetical protein ANO11243_008270 [Dothideomycetidae sp. 11243]|nr:hypothetical protein ANO11243_008270 [fungal sp. No.11243]